MVKSLSVTLCLILLFSPAAYAKDNTEARLKKEFGPDLTRVPFFLRFTYTQKNGKDWSQTFYTERKEFLINYEASALEEQAKEKAEAKAAADAQKERIREKKEADREASARKKAELAEQKAEQAAEKERQKEFNDAIKQQQKELRDMQRQATQGSSDN